MKDLVFRHIVNDKAKKEFKNGDMKKTDKKEK